MNLGVAFGHVDGNLAQVVEGFDGGMGLEGGPDGEGRWGLEGGGFPVRGRGVEGGD